MNTHADKKGVDAEVGHPAMLVATQDDATTDVHKGVARPAKEHDEQVFDRALLPTMLSGL